MSTPRKPKQRQQHHHSIPTPTIPASDYETDVQTFNETHPPPLRRTNSELNLSVLRRQNPLIRSIPSLAANAVVYLFTPATQQWEKSGIEGTLFVCEQEPSAVTGGESSCIVVLNRRSLDNLILDLGDIQDVEVANELLIMRFQDAGAENEIPKVMGLWIHEDKDDTRDRNFGQIMQYWETARASKLQGLAGAKTVANVGASGLARNPEPVGVGRRISLSDLFRPSSSQ